MVSPRTLRPDVSQTAPTKLSNKLSSQPSSPEDVGVGELCSACLTEDIWQKDGALYFELEKGAVSI